MKNILPFASRKDLIGLMICALVAVIIILFHYREDVLLLVEYDSYHKDAATVLGYKIPSPFTANSNIIETLSKPNILNKQKYTGGSYRMQCTEDFFGIKFNYCDIGVGEDGIRILTAETSPVEKIDYKRAIRRANKVFGKPVYQEANFVSWGLWDVRLEFVYDYKKDGSKDVIIMYGYLK